MSRQSHFDRAMKNNNDLSKQRINEQYYSSGPGPYLTNTLKFEAGEKNGALVISAHGLILSSMDDDGEEEC